MYPTRTSMHELLVRMDHVFERIRILGRTRALRKDEIEEIDRHLTEIMKILNRYN
ncbi:MULTISPECIES: hypothetical protein [unclassified Methanothermobacter]|uniref:Uncharacterized protein n=2 Tax=Methanobacteriaceae TaxID=2159 RepID=D9PTZ1_METTM|nr:MULTISPECIES: hypothetical protein [unclassified Methanothermobacter]ADL57689.1 hypothetical protein MTBMA_c00790 [Methanothermobacter marburgensis str. Marburg]MDI9617894.1 hypothetical protein [Methanothermobacter sp.]